MQMKPCFLHSTTGLEGALASLDRFSTRLVLVTGKSGNRGVSESKHVSALRLVVDERTNDRENQKVK